MRKTIVTIAVIALVILAGAWAYRAWLAPRGATQQTQGQVITVRRGTIEATVNASGVIQPEKQLALTFKSAGRIESISVAKGQQVRAGEILARLETDELSLQVEQARIALQIAEQRAKLASTTPAAADIAAAEAALKAARESLARLQQGPTEGQLAAAEASLQAAQARYDKVAAGASAEDLRRAKLAIDQAKNSLWGAQNARDSAGLSAQLGGPRSQYDQAQAQVLNAEIAVELAELSYKALQKSAGEAEILAAQASLEQAKDALETLRSSPRPSDIAAAESQVAQAEASLARLRKGASAEELAIADAQVAQARLSLQQAELMLKGAAIAAPFDGLVASVNAQEGALVSAATPAIALIDVSRFRIEVNVDEIDVALVQEGQSVQLTVDALPDAEINGFVAHVAPVATLETGLTAYVVEIDIAPVAGMRAGMSANADIKVQRKDDVLLVPNRAIRIDRSDGTYHVERWVNGQPVDAQVIPGMRDDTYSEIVSGLQEGEELIIRSQSLREQVSSLMGG